MASYNEEMTNLVAAFDFGTTYSAYAYAFCPKDKTKFTSHDIHINKNWGAEMSVQLPKTPTTVLVKDDGDFVSFGHQAEKDYYSKFEDDESESGRYHLIRHFKMMLYHEKKLSRSTKVESLTGKLFPAIDIFAMALKFLKDHLLKEALSQQLDREVTEETTKWVLTIPAIWNDSAKQFMREAALEAGMITSKDSKQLVFALEPEAASVICRGLEVNHFEGIPEKTMDLAFPRGTKYMIIDAGGGTVDITSHEILHNGNIKEITYASGGNWGGSEVNKKFEELLKDVFGQTFVNAYKEECTLQWFDLINDFEKIKRDINTGSTVMKIPLPFGFNEKLSEVNDRNLDHENINFSVGLNLENEEIVLNRDVISRLFVVDEIITHVNGKMNDNVLEDLKYILLVGGYGGSEILFQKLKQEFSKKTTVITPSDAELSIVKGAVMFGINPSIITARVARKTYGYNTNVDFLEGVHEEDRKFENDKGEVLCRGAFQTLVKKGETVELDNIRTFNAVPTYKTQTKVSFDFYTTDKVDVLYADDEQNQKVGELKITVPAAMGAKDTRKFKVKVFFGHPELLIELNDKSKHSHNKGSLELALDFLLE